MAKGSPEQRQRRLMPGTALGMWSVALIGGVAVGAAALIGAAASGQTFHDNHWLGIPLVVMMASAAGSIVIGLVAFLRRCERSVFAIAATVASTLVLLFIALAQVFGG
jgi:uncharacterized membrane protein YozB (DUF420 family)